ncbi:MAG: enoyl-CoA hydratase-related protein, partial [bacterium]|nr:enoyl-CoA hydratase-related protein [bacterium]
RLVQKNAQLGLTECALGIIPGAGGTQRLPQLVGISKAKELIFMAQKISAKEAKAIGLVNYVLETKLDLLNTAKEWAEKIAKCAPLSIKAAKTAIEGSLFLDKNAGLLLEMKSYESILASADRKEGLAAFSEKRVPVFQGS